MVRRLAVLVTACTAFAACGLTEPGSEPERELMRARARWDAAALGSYQIVVQRSCECLPEFTRAIRVAARDRTVLEAHYADTGEPVPAAVAQQPYLTVAGMFDRIEDALGQRPDDFHATYESAYGYPTAIFVDYDRRMADEEFILSARDLLPQ
ncbi:MAG: DUF6174 domain-containing protein [Longimicrobiales bacterium]